MLGNAQFPPDDSSARIVPFSVAVAPTGFMMPPPKFENPLLPEKVLLVTVSDPSLTTAPPMPVAWLAEKVLLVRSPP